MAAPVFVRREPGLRQSPRQRSGCVGEKVSALGRQNLPAMPMSATSTSPQCARPGMRRWPGFRAAKVTVRIGLDGDAPHRSRVAVDAGGQVDGENRQARSVHPLDRRARAAPSRSRARPAAEERIDDQVGVGEGCLVRSRDRSGPVPRGFAPHRPSGAPASQKSRDDVDGPARPGVARRDETVAAILTGSGDESRSACRRDHLRGRLGHGARRPAASASIAGRPGRDGFKRRPASSRRGSEASSGGCSWRAKWTRLSTIRRSDFPQLHKL